MSFVERIRGPRIAVLGLLLAAGLLFFSVYLMGCGGGDEAAEGPPVRPPSLVRVAQLKKQPVSRKIIVVGNVTPVRTSVVASGANGVVQFLKVSPLKDVVPDFSETSPGQPNESEERIPSPSDPEVVSPGERPSPEQEEFPEIEIGQYVTKGTVLSVLRMEATNNELAEAQAFLKEKDHKFKAEREIHPKELAHAEAMVKMAEAVLKNAENKWKRAESLFNRGLATETEYDDAREKYEAARQSLIAAEENRAQVTAGLKVEQAQASRDAQAAHFAYLLSEKEKRTTRAPFDGFIIQEHTYVGQWLSKGDPVVTLAKMDYVDVMVHVDQADILYVTPGQSVGVEVPGASRSEWEGRVVHIVPKSDWESGSRGFPVVVRIKNELEDVEISGNGETIVRKTPALKAGMMARVTIHGPEVETLLAHKDALVRTTRGTNVFVFDPKEPSAKFDPEVPTMGGVRQISVEADLHMSDGEFIGIRPSKGMSATDNPLQPGAWVVTEGGERFNAPVQDNVNALSRVPTATNGE